MHIMLFVLISFVLVSVFWVFFSIFFTDKSKKWLILPIGITIFYSATLSIILSCGNMNVSVFEPMKIEVIDSDYGKTQRITWLEGEEERSMVAKGYFPDNNMVIELSQYTFSIFHFHPIRRIIKHELPIILQNPALVVPMPPVPPVEDGENHGT